MIGLGTRNEDAQVLQGPHELLTLNVRGDQTPELCIILKSYSAGQLEVLRRQS